MKHAELVQHVSQPNTNRCFCLLKSILRDRIPLFLCSVTRNNDEKFVRTLKSPMPESHDDLGRKTYSRRITEETKMSRTGEWSFGDILRLARQWLWDKFVAAMQVEKRARISRRLRFWCLSQVAISTEWGSAGQTLSGRLPAPVAPACDDARVYSPESSERRHEDIAANETANFACRTVTRETFEITVSVPGFVESRTR